MPATPVRMFSLAVLTLTMVFSIEGQAAELEPSDTTKDERYQARAIVTAFTELTLSSEIAGRIAELPFREGERFTKGQTLVRFDCRAYEGKLQVAQATLKAARLTYTNQKRRAELDAAGKLEVALAQAEVERAQGEVITARFPVDRCNIQAPFEGRVVALNAHRYETLSVGAPLIHILDDSRMEIKIIIPSHWLSWIKPGSSFDLHVDETGLSLQGKVTRIGSMIDAVSQSLPVFSILDSPDETLVSGMSGTARFHLPPSSKSKH